MKKVKSIFYILSFLTFGFGFYSCGGGSSNSNANQTEVKGKEYTAAYICPMHCEGSGSDSMGKCPVCGMDYVKNEEHHSDGHQH